MCLVSVLEAWFLAVVLPCGALKRQGPVGVAGSLEAVPLEGMAAPLVESAPAGWVVREEEA